MATAKKSAGILAYRFSDNGIEVLLGHPGGPLFKRKDVGVWSIPKGEFAADEAPFEAAKREFFEEIGTHITVTDFIELAPIVQRGGKMVYAWAANFNVDIENFECNNFSMEWPPKSGQFKEFPELDKIAWLSLAIAREKINVRQSSFLDELVEKLKL